MKQPLKLATPEDKGEEPVLLGMVGANAHGLQLVFDRKTSFNETEGFDTVWQIPWRTIGAALIYHYNAHKDEKTL